MFCRKCGKEIPDDSEFCYKCGVRVVSIDDNSERVVTPAPADNVAERAAENPKINLDKPETSQNQQNDLEKDSAVEITSRRCEFCGKEVFSNEPKCSRCNAPNPEFDRIHFTAPIIESHSNTSSEDHNNLDQSVSLKSSNSMSRSSGKYILHSVPHKISGSTDDEEKEEKYGQFRKITLGIGWGLTVLWYLIVGGISGFWEIMGYVGGGIGFIAFISFLISFSWGPAVIIVIRKIILCVMCVTKFEPEFRMEHEQISGIRYIVASILGFIITGPMCGGCMNDMEGAVSVALYLAIPLMAVGITSFICYGVLKKAAVKQK